MYLLDQAVKIDEEKNHVRSFLIEDGQVRYVTKSFEKWSKKRIALNGTIMTNTRTVYDESLLDCCDYNQFQEVQKDLIKQGCTTIVVAPFVSFEKAIEAEYKRAKHALASSTLDYVVGLTIPIQLLRSETIRKCQQLHIPLIRISLSSLAELQKLPWTHLSQTLLPYPVVLVPVIECRTNAHVLLKAWVSYCENYHIHTLNALSPHQMWLKSALQKVGIYPKKGAMLVGSDSDYLLFKSKHSYLNNYPQLESTSIASDLRMFYHEKEPDIVVIRSEIIKANNEIILKPGFGKCIDIRKPGRFLSIQDRQDEAELKQHLG